jgi:autoinducer 2 (AI-2) kinase
MATSWLMSLDIGGGTGRCLLVDTATGRIVTSARAWRHPVVPGSGGWGVGFDTDGAWARLGEAAREAVARAGIGVADVAAIATTGMRHGTVVVDRAGKVRFAVPTRDARAAGAASELAAERGDEIARRTGHWPAPLFCAARLRYLQQSAPDTLAGAAWVLGLSDWLAYRMTGRAAVEASIASATALCRLDRRDWDRELILALGLPVALFPEVVSAGDPLGPITAAAATHLGVAPGTPVVAGGGDTQCGLIGAGALHEGAVGVVAGTTMPVQRVVASPVVDEARRLWTSHHAAPGHWVLESNAGPTGDMLAWLGGILYPDAPVGAAALAADAARGPVGAGGALSSLGTDVFSAAQLGLPLGHLTLSPLGAAVDGDGRQTIARAVVEGVALGLRANLDQLGAPASRATRDLRLCGGMTRSPSLCQLLCDVIGAPLRVARTPEASALGAALCAGVGAGTLPDLGAAVAALAPTTWYEPDRAVGPAYDDLYQTWCELHIARADADDIARGAVLSAMTARANATVVDTPSGFRPRIHVTAALDEVALDQLRALGDVTYASFRDELDLLVGDDLVDALTGVHVFVTEVDVVDADVLARARDLRVVVSCRGNPVNLDIPACTAHGVPVLGTPGRNAEAVADLTMAFLLMLARKLPAATSFLREPGGEAGDTARMGIAFARFLGRELGGKVVGLIGFGAVGQRVARRARAFGARVLAYDPFLAADRIALGGAEAASFEDLLAESDIVSLHAAVTDESRTLLGAAELAAMKPGAFLVNTARAALVDETALIDALGSGRLGGAALDVFAAEPPGADDPLLALPNVIATPHVGGNTVEVFTHQGRIVAADLACLLAGGRPANLLNPEVMARFSFAGARPTINAAALAELGARSGPSVTDLEVAAAAVPSPETPAGQGGRSARPADAARAAAAGDAGDSADTGPAGRPARGLLRRLRDIFSSRSAAAKNGKANGHAVAPSAGGHALARSRIETVLADFLRRLERDETLLAFAAQRDLTVVYQLHDADVGFYMHFADGAVQGGLGAPPRPAQVTLKMKAEIFDQLFSGTASGPRLAMSGKLSFSGDTLKAMSMRRLQPDINRIYGEARAAHGGVDEALLALVGGGPPEAAASAAAKPAARGTGTWPIVGTERDELFRIVEEMVAAGVITATGGNASVRVAGRPDQLWITPNGLAKGALSPELMVRIDLDGNPLDPGAGTPSSERLIHCQVLRANPGLAAVIHSHAPKATTLALAELAFLPISTEAAFIGEIPRVPFLMPGTPALADAVAAALAQAPAALMQNHGLVVAGADLRHAANLTLIIEQTADKLVTCALLGKTPPVLPDELVASLRELGEMLA